VRLVAAADTERRRLKHDLHDGAQQRLLTLSYELRLAETDAIAAGDAPLSYMLATATDKTVVPGPAALAVPRSVSSTGILAG